MSLLCQGVVDELRALGSPTAAHLVDLAPHFAGAAAGEIVLPWCAGCERAHWYPSPVCPGCGDPGWEWRSFGDLAHLDSWTVVHHPLAEALRTQVPFTIGLLVPDGAPDVRLVAVLDVAPEDSPEIDRPMTARPGPEIDGGRLLVFAPAVRP
jgi:hypothetical protein